MTDPFDAAAAAGHQLQQQLAETTQALAAETAQEQADEATIAALRQQIADLEAQINPQPAGPIPGVNATSAAQHATQCQVWGLPVQPWCWRYYLQPGEPLHLPTEYKLGPGETIVISNGNPPQNLTIAQLAAFFATFPTDRDTYFCLRHEPESKVKRGEFTPAQLKAAWHVARLAQQQVGNPRIKLVVILMDYTWQKGSGRNPEDYIPAAADFDLLSVDTYYNGSIGLDISTAGAQLDAVIATAKAHGKPWAVTEAGVGPKLTGQARLDAITTLAKTIKAKGAVLALWFDMGSPTNEWWLDPAGVAAWKAGLTG